MTTIDYIGRGCYRAYYPTEFKYDYNITMLYTIKKGVLHVISITQSKVKTWIEYAQYLFEKQYMEDMEANMFPDLAKFQSDFNTTKNNKDEIQ